MALIRLGRETIARYTTRESIAAFSLSTAVNVGIVAALLYAPHASLSRSSGQAGASRSLDVFSIAAPTTEPDQGAPAAGKAADRPEAGLIESAHALVRKKTIASGAAAVGATTATGIAPTQSVAVPAAAMTGSVSSALSSAASSDYPRALLAHIRPYFRYPDLGDARPQGPPRIGVALNRLGHVTRIWIVDTSGNNALDRAAIDAIMRSDPMPQIPDGLPDQIDLVVPVDFSPGISIAGGGPLR